MKKEILSLVVFSSLLVVILNITAFASEKPVERRPTTCCLLRGDVDHNGVYNVPDMSYLTAYLKSLGPAPPCYEEADMDGYNVVTISDLIYLLHYWHGGPAPYPCSYTNSPPLSGPVDSNNYLELVGNVFDANATSIVLHFNLNTTKWLHMGVLPIRIRVRGEVPTVTNCQLTSLLDGFTTVPPSC
jgi:hypothetical protein